MSLQINRNGVSVNQIRKSLRSRIACESLEGRALLSGMAAGTGAWHSFAASHGVSATSTADVSTRFHGRADRFDAANHTAGASTSAISSSSTTASSTSTTDPMDFNNAPDGKGKGGFDPKGGPGGAPGIGLGGAGTSLSQLVGIDAGGLGVGGGPADGGRGMGDPGKGKGMMPMAKDQTGSTTSPTTPPTMPTLPAAVTAAQTALQTDLKAALPAGFQSPSKDALTALQTDLKAQKDGTLTGTDATTKIQADKIAILVSTGLTSDQATAVDTASKQLDTDTKGLKNDGTAPSATDTAKFQADTDAILSAAGLTTTQITAIDAAHAQMKTDGDAIKAGTLTGTAATTALQTDHDSLLVALGVSQDNITKLDADTTALTAAMKTAFGSMTPTFPTTKGMPTPTGAVGQRFGRG